MYRLEMILAKAYQLNKQLPAAQKMEQLAAKRKAAIIRYCWNEQAGYYFDWRISTQQQMTNKTIAGAFPLFFQIAPAAQAPSIAKVVEQDFLKAGGVVTTLVHSGQQWDAPNGWAPLQWMTIQGLRNYQQNALAENIAKRWIQVNTDVYARTGKMMEKYNVENTTLEAGGGEYPGQDGFGWTNGVLLKLISLYGKH
jgi:alpha,alpha-trehalase